MIKCNLPRLPRGVQIIEVESMSLVEKDIIFIRNFEDFKFLLGDSMTIFKLNNLLYAMTAHVAYVFDCSMKVKVKEE